MMSFYHSNMGGSLPTGEKSRRVANRFAGSIKA
jgi:hypothetical protein